MNWPRQCAAVIPCLNESATIAPLIAAVIRHVPNIFLVDDGSTDETARLAENAGANVLRHGKTQGKGAALRTGWMAARNAGFDWALTMDGDGQHSPEDIPNFFKCAEETASVLVIGNRMGKSQKMPHLRRFVNRWMSARISALAGQSFPDSQSGFRLMNLHAWATLPICAAHFEIESDVLLAFARSGQRIGFVPIQVIYKTEQSKIHPVRDTVRWFRWWRAMKRLESERAFAFNDNIPVSIGSQFRTRAE
ncbi:MAG TPA: glycosyltransferase family 2 protein [Verrucomicrobiae bacterium]|nr:glycosyltransferase family 2 protein [Verrucomicrobiae bacterium]